MAAGEDKANEGKQLSDLLELEKLYLSRTISLKDGTFGFLFTKSGGSANSEPNYQCHPCDLKLVGRNEFLVHVNDSKHVSVMERENFKRENFTRVLEFGSQRDTATYIVPGEPVPPGMEGIVELPPCEIQNALDEHVEPALIGLEYLVEIVNEYEVVDPTKPRVRVSYMCMLCEKKGTSFNIITHVGSPNHHINYFRRYFPNVFSPIDKFPKVIENKEGVGSIVRRIAAKIEKKYGRMKPRSVSNAQMMSSDGKMAIMNEINTGQHLTEDAEDVEEWKKFINFKYVLRPEQLAIDYPPSPPPPRPKKREVTPPSLYAGKKPTGRLFRKSSPEIVFDKEMGVKVKRPRRDSLSSVSSTNSKDKFPVKDTSPISVSSNPRSRSRSPRFKPYRRTSPSGRGRGDRSSPPRYRRGGYDNRSGGRVRSREQIPGARPSGRGRSRSRERDRRPSPPVRHPPHRRSRSPRSFRDSREGREGHVPSKPHPNERGPGRVAPFRGSSHRSRSRSPPVYRGRELPYPHRERKVEEPPVRRARSPREKSRERSYEDARRQKVRNKLEEFKEELARIEIELLDKLKFHEKNPEKHPLYPEEWKLFWNRRYKELQAEGKDPNSYDFKPEWIDFWDKRMKELHDSDLLEKKKALKDRLGITSESLRSKSPVTDLKNTWASLTGAEIRSRKTRSPSPRAIVPRREREGSRRSRSQSPRRERSPSRRDRERERYLSPRRERELSPRRERDDYPPEDMMPYGHPHMPPFPPPHGHPFPPRFPPGHMMYPGGPRPRFMPRMPLPPGVPFLPPGMAHLPPSGKVFTEAPLNIITVLRTLTVLENQLGSLGPKCVELLSKALAMEKNKPTSSVLLMHENNCVMFETIKEKLRGQLMTGVVERHMVNASRHAIKSVEALLFHAPKIEKPDEGESSEQDGVDLIDKEAIAKQIAAALVAQGRPDVSNEELEVLIEEVIKMAKAQAESTGKEVNTKNILSQLQGGDADDSHSPQPVEEKPKETQYSASKNDSSSVGGLDMLQSSYDNDDAHKDEGMEQLSERDVKDLLRNFKTLSRKEQLGLITYLSELEAKDPVKVKVYRKYLEIDDPETKKLASSPVKKVPASEGERNSRPGASLSRKSSESQFFVTAETGTEPISDEDEDDENYSIEEVYKVAAAKVEEKKKLENPTPPDPAAPAGVAAPEDTPDVDVATMSASQASNILDWIKQNASESTDLFKTLLSGSNSNVANVAEESVAAASNSQSSTSVEPAPVPLPGMNSSQPLQPAPNSQPPQEKVPNPVAPPPPPSQAPTSQATPSTQAPALPFGQVQPDPNVSQFNPMVPQQVPMGNFQNPSMMMGPGPGMMMGMTPCGPMMGGAPMMGGPSGPVMGPGGPMSGPYPMGGPQGPPQEAYGNNFQSNSNDSNSKNYQDNQQYYDDNNEYDDYDDSNQGYNSQDGGGYNSNEYNNKNKGNKRGSGRNVFIPRGNKSRGGGGGGGRGGGGVGRGRGGRGNNRR
ncbi:hypothetical protein WDU94_004846 [Cyamophila willieti]